MKERKTQTQRLTQAQKEAHDKKWYKEQADRIDSEDAGTGYGDVLEQKRMKVNYDLFNNILNLADFAYVCQPFGAEVGELPASMVNRDISSGKIKAVLGMEQKRPFSWKVIASNPEATTRREQEEFKRIREYVINSIMLPIRQEAEAQMMQQQQGQEMTPEQMQQIQAQIEEQTKAMTPAEVKKYMQREHQDPVEVMSHQLLEYLYRKCELKRKFNDAFKHGLLSAKGIMYVGILNGEPEVWNVNSMRFRCDKSDDTYFTHKSEWASCEYRMTPSQILSYFSDEFSQKEIDQLYENYSHYKEDRLRDSLFNFDPYEDNSNSTLRVLHTVWKSLRKIGFLTYMDDNEMEQEMIVDENYDMSEEAGDINIEWEWIPEVYETWKIGADIYKHMRPIPGQFKDLDNLYVCNLPYYGVIYDNMNSEETSLMDRLKVYQYYYNIVMYRLEILLASDKGKKVLMNINAIPDSMGIDIEKWKYFLEASPIMWYNPNEEGTEYNDVNTVAKQVDFSLASDIGKYIELAEYLRTQAGLSTGITPNVEGQTSAREAVKNVQQDLIQSSHILEPYFQMHGHLKKEVLQALLEMGKIAYSQSGKKKLSYVLDDMSRRIIDLDVGLLDASTLGIFVADSGKAEEARQLIRELTHAAMQTQKVELSDIISVVRQEGIVEAEETLKAAEQERKEFEQDMQQQQLKAQAEEAEKQRSFQREEWKNEKEQIILKERERRETEIVKGALTAASFNPDKDSDGDGINDFIEIAKDGLDANIKVSKQRLDEQKFQHQKNIDKEKLDLEKKKLKAAKEKSTSS